jgi:hypothetical protein
MSRKLMVFLTGQTVSAAEVDGNGGLQYVSFGGNRSRALANEQDIHAFCENIFDVYNIESLAELDADCLILNNGAAQAMVHRVYHALEECTTLSVVEAQAALPIAVLNRGAMESGTRMVVQYAGRQYAVECDQNGVIGVRPGRGEADLTLEDADLAFLHHFNAGNLSGGAALKKHLDAVQETLANVRREAKQQAQALADAQKILRVYQEKEQQEAERLTEEERQLAERRTLVEVVFETVKAMEVYGWSNSRQVLFFRNQSLGDEGTFNPGQTLGSLRMNQEGKPDSNFRLKKVKSYQYDHEKYATLSLDAGLKIRIQAKTSGKIFYLTKDLSTVNSGDCVAILADAKDTREAVMDWYEAQKSASNAPSRAK